MVFLVWVPGESGDGEGLRWRVDVAEASSLFEGCELECRGVKGGPDGGDGVVCAGYLPKQRDGRCVMYKPAEQTWFAIPDGGGVQVGIWNALSPTPKTLERERMHESHPVTLEDGQTWRVPIVRMFPRLMHYGLDGDVEVGKPVPRVAKAFESVERVIRDMETHGDTAASWASLMEAGTELLKLNYRLELHGLDRLLQVWSQDTLRDVLMAAMDEPGLKAMVEDQKKSDGSEATGITSGQPGPGAP